MSLFLECFKLNFGTHERGFLLAQIQELAPNAKKNTTNEPIIVPSRVGYRLSFLSPQKPSFRPKSDTKSHRNLFSQGVVRHPFNFAQNQRFYWLCDPSCEIREKSENKNSANAKFVSLVPQWFSPFCLKFF